MPHAFVDQHARITICPTCRGTLLGMPIYNGEARCQDCGFTASVEPRPGDNQPAAESASEVGLRIKRLRGENTGDQANEQPES